MGNIAHHHHNRFTAVFLGLSGWAGARRELLDFMVQGKINRGRHTDHLAGRHSIPSRLTSAHLHHPHIPQMGEHKIGNLNQANSLCVRCSTTNNLSLSASYEWDTASVLQYVSALQEWYIIHHTWTVSSCHEAAERPVFSLSKYRRLLRSLLQSSRSPLGIVDALLLLLMAYNRCNPQWKWNLGTVAVS